MEMNIDKPRRFVDNPEDGAGGVGGAAQSNGAGAGPAGGVVAEDDPNPIAGAVGGGDDDSDDQDEDELPTDERMEEEDEEASENENGAIQSPSAKTTTSTNSDNESESDVSSVSDSKSLEASPAKRRKENPAMLKGLKHHQELRRTKTPYLQDKPCRKFLRRKNTNTTNKKTINKRGILMCCDCKVDPNPNAPRKSKDAPECRFLSFRKLYYSNSHTMKVAGFPDVSSFEPSDKRLWMPEDPPAKTSLELAKFLLEEVGDQFCDLVKQENETLDDLILVQEDKNVIWRRVVKNLRELCDVCSTTLFNFHFTCGKCGFVVCISCFRARKQESSVPRARMGDGKDEFGWQICHRHIGKHDIETLLVTQIIAGDSLNELSKQLHELRGKLGLPQGCECEVTVKPDPDWIAIAASSGTSGRTPQKQDNGNDGTPSLVEDANSANGAAKPANGASQDSDKENDDSDDDLMSLMLGPNENPANDPVENNVTVAEDDDDDLMSLMVGETENNGNAEPNEVSEVKESDRPAEKGPPSNIDAKPKKVEVVLKHFTRKVKGIDSKTYVIKVHPKNLMSTAESTRRYPTVPHSWFCKGHLLRLEDPVNPGNLEMFQNQWKRGQPVLFSNVANNLNKELWSPESFSRDFGDKRNPLINCITGRVVHGKRIRVFWDGFEHMGRRLQDQNGTPMLLKLKDWPPGEDFKDICPKRFEDLMNALPLGEYTHRDGELNLAGRLPEIFSRPDLGPKMYIAYGSGLHLDKGTTNVHLDISDAVNVMVHVGEVQDADITEHRAAVNKAIAESDCDPIMTSRALKNEELPGALWHIWEAKDADKIRDLINKVNIKKGVRVEPHHDPIHDQSIYLDEGLRQKLREDYNVDGYPILQCAGDAVFIPAGAPHQVRNLNNCIKIAEDFVSPENVGHCFYLTEEFRNLSETHTNHEDKLQIKNIVYHTVKDAVAVINASLKKPVGPTNQQLGDNE